MSVINMRKTIFAHFSQNWETEPFYIETGTIWAELDAPRQRASFEIPRSANSCCFLPFWVQIIARLYSDGFFHGHTSTRRRDHGPAGPGSPITAWGWAAPDQHCLLWATKDNFISPCFFFRQLLDPAEWHRECQDRAWTHGSPGPEQQQHQRQPQPWALGQGQDEVQWGHGQDRPDRIASGLWNKNHPKEQECHPLSSDKLRDQV